MVDPIPACMQTRRARPPPQGATTIGEKRSALMLMKNVDFNKKWQCVRVGKIIL